MFTAGATEGLNIIAEWYKDVPVIITEAEHTANILPDSIRQNSRQW